MKRIILTATAWMFFALSVWAEDDAYTISLQGMPQGEYYVSLQKENGQHGNLVLLKQ